MSYTDRKMKAIQDGSSLQTSAHESLLFGRSHLVQIPSVANFTGFAFHATAVLMPGSFPLLSSTLALRH